ncbi:ribosome biogenesis protein BMS1 homolog isoform X2 [Artemia franciscana]|uniref:ribosome biogenesis protein BMS1 homolog isoform X2 n=1 Tax=Artemia franciscana TaxID=6661 RepID=UPI0032DB36B5
MDEDIFDKKKQHRERHAGRKAEKKKGKNEHQQDLTAQQRNPKAFAINSVKKAQRQFHRAQDLKTKKQHIPLVDRTPVEPPPIVVAIVGPPKVGKSTLLRCLIKNFTRQNLSEINGPVTIVCGKKRRVTFIECNNDINSMIDIAKVADLCLLLVDASFGFEMEVFEFLNICQVHGFPRIMGVLTHLDYFKDNKQLKKRKKLLKHRFWTEVYQGAKLFYLSGMVHGEYQRTEVKNLGRFISVMKFRPLQWRTTHPYVFVDRLEDITPPQDLHLDQKCDRTVCFYGFVRGVNFKNHCGVHIPGCGDLRVRDMAFLPDPCPLPEKLKKRSLVDKEKLIYAPMSGVGGIVYDKDAVYIDLGGSHSHKDQKLDKGEDENEMVTSMGDLQAGVDEKIAQSQVQIFTDSAPITSVDAESFKLPSVNVVVDSTGRQRRKAVFSTADEQVMIDEEEEDDSEDLDEEDLDETEAEDSKNTASMVNKSQTVQNESLIFDESEEEDERRSIKKAVRKSDKKISPTKKLRSKLADVLDENESEVEENFDSDAEYDLRDVSDRDDDGSEEEPMRKKAKVVSRRTVQTGNDELRKKLKEVIESVESKLGNQVKKKNRKVSANEDLENSVGEYDSDIMTGKLDKEDDESDEEEELSADEEKASDEEEEASDEEEEESGLQWKTNIAQKAAEAFYERQAVGANLRKLIYGSTEQTRNETQGEEEEEIGGLFKIASRATLKANLVTMDEFDCTKWSNAPIQDFTAESVLESVRDCFVTGNWKESENAEELLRMDDDSDFDMEGDFEDLETGEIHKVSDKDQKAISDQEDSDPINKKTSTGPVDEEAERQKLIEKKMKLKERFDAEYDETEGGGQKSFYEELKQEVDAQANMNKSEFEGLDDEIRVQYEGFRPGMYVRIEISHVPCELVSNFDPTYPLIVGALLPGEENIGYVQVRLKKHRWHKRILKTRDPLTVSMGWRRFQTLPLYSIQDHNMRNRSLKYTPEHLHCMATFWGPITPQGTGMLAIQSMNSSEPGFRISATGSVVDQDKSTQIMKKLKLVGTPFKIYRKTAFIEGMFSSSLEVAKFEGASIKTVSGIRGQIKKAVRKPEGSFRATFEDKIVLSDIVFVRTWFRVDVPRFYTAVTSLLLPASEKNKWQGVKTVGQLKRERSVRAEVNTDHLYLPVLREEKVFAPLVVPRSLQRQLPYDYKPKAEVAAPLPGSKRDIEGKRVAVVLEPKERKVLGLMKILKTRYTERQDKLHKEAVQRIKEHRKKVEASEEQKLKRQRELKQKVSRVLSKMEAKKERDFGKIRKKKR